MSVVQNDRKQGGKTTYWTIGSIETAFGNHVVEHATGFYGFKKYGTHVSNRTCIEPERQLIFGPIGLPAAAARVNSDCYSLHVL